MHSLSQVCPCNASFDYLGCGSPLQFSRKDAELAHLWLAGHATSIPENMLPNNISFEEPKDITIHTSLFWLSVEQANIRADAAPTIEKSVLW